MGPFLDGLSSLARFGSRDRLVNGLDELGCVNADQQRQRLNPNHLVDECRDAEKRRHFASVERLCTCGVNTRRKIAGFMAF